MKRDVQLGPYFAGSRRDRPFVFMNMAITADGKIATANHAVASFGSPRDQAHLLKLRACADAVMVGARTVNLNPITLGPGPRKYRRLRMRNGFSEYNLRVIVSGSGTVDPKAALFRHRFSPILILTTRHISAGRLKRLRQVADEVKVCGDNEVDWRLVLQWLAKEWRVRRLLVEGGGELNDALFRQGCVDELHLTVCPLVCGGATAPTLADGLGFARLDEAVILRLKTLRRHRDEVFLVFDVYPNKRGKGGRLPGSRKMV
jgi:riboflavin-specific deaminase-like protein